MLYSTPYINRYAQQQLTTQKEFLEEHPQLRGHEWLRNPMRREKLEPLLASIIGIGIVGIVEFPTLRVCIINLLFISLIIILISILYRFHRSMKWPFSSNNFSSIMSGRRFDMLRKYLHLNDSQRQPGCSSALYDELFKIRPFVVQIIQLFQDVYSTSKHISIDESIIGFKGRLSWIHYMPKNPTKWGIKAWVLADPAMDMCGTCNSTRVKYNYISFHQQLLTYHCIKCRQG